jgi:hypothetical protein
MSDWLVWSLFVGGGLIVVAISKSVLVAVALAALCICLGVLLWRKSR